MKISSVKCVGCAAPLQIRTDTTEIVCEYCNCLQFVDRTSGATSRTQDNDPKERGKHSPDRTASELALVRLHRELYSIPFGDCYDEPVEPLRPDLPKRPDERSLLRRIFEGILMGSIAATVRSNEKLFIEIWEADVKILKESYESQMAAYNQAMRDWPERKKASDKINADGEARAREIRNEIAIHEAIVKRTSADF